MNSLDAPTLLLSKMWEPLHATTVRRALSLAYQDAARLVDPDTFQAYSLLDWAVADVHENGPEVRAPSITIKAPEVAVLTRHTPVLFREIVFSHRNVMKRDRYTCQYCGAQPGVSELAVDPVVPTARGGAVNWTNCVTACDRCRQRKGDRIPCEVGLALRRSPRRPAFTPVSASDEQDRPASWSAFLGNRG